MSAITVREQPSAFNTYTLDTVRCPGTTVPSGGDVKEKIDDQRSPLTTGANTVVQFSENPVVTYEHTLVTIEELQAMDVWIAMFLEGRTRRPPKVYQILDLRARWLKRVIFEAVSPQKVERPGGPWTRTIVLHTWNKVVPYGGPVKPGYLDAQITAAQAEGAALRAQRAATHTQAKSWGGK